MLIHAAIVLLVAVAITQATVFATSIYLHRTLAHRALVLHPLADWGCRALLWITTGQSSREWVAVHRKHHTFTDREGDPHSPLVHGFWKVQLFNAYYYAREARNPETVKKFAPDIAQDGWDRYVFGWGWMGPILGTAALCLMLGFWPGIIAGLLHALLYVGVLAPSINGLSHWRGAQNFANTAYNRRVLAWFTGGESLHNNHHAFPRAPKFSVGRFEFDPSWVVIRFGAALRLIGIIGATAKLPQ